MVDSVGVPESKRHYSGEENQDTCEDFRSPWLEEAEGGRAGSAMFQVLFARGVLLVLQERHTLSPMHYGSRADWSYCFCPLHMVTNGHYQQGRDLKGSAQVLEERYGGWNLSI